jgi:hypothetical protein
VGDELVAGEVGQDSDVFGGYRIGWDFDHYWGTEARFGFAYLRATDEQAGTRLDWARQDYWDGSLLYYPWGDARWRPFASAGIGLAYFRFQHPTRGTVGETLFAAPVGLGVKYLYRPWMALRFTALDNIAVGNNGLSTMHNVSLTGGVEVRFGGPRISYYPYHGDVHLWW